MYVPRLNAVTDDDEINAFIRRHAFAILVSADAAGALQATHLPLELTVSTAGERTLAGHMARANPHWRALTPSTSVLAIFSGPDAYISPRWYDHPNVPTWNYLTVHAYGRVRLIEAEAELLALLTRQVDHYEADPGTYRLADQPTEVVRQIRGVVGLALTVERVEAKFKLSQNRSPGDYANVIRELERRGDAASQAVAEAMKRAQPDGKDRA
jgi:transcriptional regulator